MSYMYSSFAYAWFWRENSVCEVRRGRETARRETATTGKNKTLELGEWKGNNDTTKLDVIVYQSAKKKKEVIKQGVKWFSSLWTTPR